MKALIQAALAAVAALALAATAAADVRTIDAAGVARTYCHVVPQQPGSPTVIFLHGAGGGCAPGNNPISDGWRAKAAAEGFRLIMPLGIEKSWNGCSVPPETCSHPRTAAETRGVNDIAFIDALRAEYPGTTYLVGVSNGGTLVYNYLCHRDGIVAAAVVASVNYAESCPDPGERLRVMHSDARNGWAFDWLTPWDGESMWSDTPPVPPGLQGFETTIHRYHCQHGWPGYSTPWGWFWGLGCTNAFRAEDVIWDWIEGL